MNFITGKIINNSPFPGIGRQITTVALEVMLNIYL